MIRVAVGHFRKMKKLGCTLFGLRIVQNEDFVTGIIRSIFLIGISSIGLSSQRYLYCFSAQIIPSRRNAFAEKNPRMCIIKDSVVGTYQHHGLVGLCQPVQIYLDPI